jgi:hypothetical protein
LALLLDLTTIIKSKPQTKKKKAVHATLAAHQGTVNLKVVASDVATSLAASADTISTADDDEMKTQDNSFYRFSQLCGDIEAEASYKAKTEIVATYIKQGSSGGNSSIKHMCVFLAMSLQWRLNRWFQRRFISPCQIAVAWCCQACIQSPKQTVTQTVQ